MTRETMWKKWGRKDGDSVSRPNKQDFLDDLTKLIEKHQAPYKNALDNISMEIENLTKVEVDHAEVAARRLG